METKINEAIEALATKAKTVLPHEALHYTQAALNLAQVLQVKQQVTALSKEGARLDAAVAS